MLQNFLIRLSLTQEEEKHLRIRVLDKIESTEGEFIGYSYHNTMDLDSVELYINLQYKRFVKIEVAVFETSLVETYGEYIDTTQHFLTFSDLKEVDFDTIIKND